MASTFLRTFSITKPLAPAQLRRENTNTEVADFKLIDSNANFNLIAAPGMVVVNVTDSKSARVVKVESATTLLLDKHIFSAVGKTYQLIRPSRAVVVPGTSQELILFHLWARNNISGGDVYKIMLSKEGLTGYQTTPLAETSSDKDYIEINNRWLPTDTEFYIFENSCLQNADMVVEGLDKTLSQLNIEAAST